MNKKLFAALLGLASIAGGSMFAGCRTGCCPRTCDKPAKPCVRYVPQHVCANKECETKCWEVCPAGFEWADGASSDVTVTNSSPKRNKKSY